MASLVQYGSSGSDSDGDNTASNEDNLLHLKPIDSEAAKHSFAKSITLAVTPEVVSRNDGTTVLHLNPKSKELDYNPRYDALFAPQAGPENPFKTEQQKAEKNTLSGFVEQTTVSAFQFENQRRTFHSYGYARDPSAETGEVVDKMVGDPEKDGESVTVFEDIKKRPGDKRKRKKNQDAGDIDGYLGPWGKFVDEKEVMKPSEEEQKELDEILSKRKKKSGKVEEKPLEEKTTLHIKDAYDYQGRSFLHIPQDTGLNLKSDEPPVKCFIPKKHIHTWEGHTKGISAIRWFPQSAHLLLSGAMDSKIKIWEVFNERRCVRTYAGHRQAVKDVTFNNSGTKFLSASYDRFCKLWDTETGQCISRFTTKKVPYCVKFNPEEDKQHLFVAGMADKKIVCWDTRTEEVVQEYDRHLGAVNSITFIDHNRRFVSTSDDKSLRVWEWDIPVDFKYISDPTMHSMPSVTMAPNAKWLACQGMDNNITIFNILNRFKYMRKKIFKGHMVAGYSCTTDFSPDMSYLISGDADGKLYVWDWKTTKLYTKFKAHEEVCIACLWHPHETSKVVTAGWDGLIKYWD